MKKSKVKNSNGTFSVEHLHHFRCKTCTKWWSIGDPKVGGMKKQIWFCPWCGEKQLMKEK